MWNSNAYGISMSIFHFFYWGVSNHRKHFLLWTKLLLFSKKLHIPNIIFPISWVDLASQVVVVKNLPANAGNVRDVGLIPVLGRSPGGGHGNPLHYSCLENPMDRGAWWATVHGVAKSWTRLKLYFNSVWTKNFQMFKLDLEKVEEPEIKLPTFVGS